MGNLVLNGQTVLTQIGTETPTLNTNVLNKGLSRLNTSASQGPTTDLTNTTLPIFACRAWVNFNGTVYTTVGAENHCTIRASGNVSKVVRTAAGRYTIYFITQMPDSNYSVNVSGMGSDDNRYTGIWPSMDEYSVSVFGHYHADYSYQEMQIMCVTIFR